MRTANPGPWLEGEAGLGAVISDGRLEAVLGIGEAHDEAARDRLAPFMAMGQLDTEQRRILLHGGDAADRGGEVCAAEVCFVKERVCEIGARKVRLVQVDAVQDAKSQVGTREVGSKTGILVSPCVPGVHS